jgi:xanthine dehydrogenase accessory factor
VRDTIGGGELERTAIFKARELLHSSGGAIMRLALGPQLNQCCGGSVTLAFEPFAPADLAWLRKLIRAAEEPSPVIRTLTIDALGNFRRDWTVGSAAGSAGKSAPIYGATLTSPSRGGRSLPGAKRLEDPGRGAGVSSPLPNADSPRASAFDLPSRGRLGRSSAVQADDGLCVEIRELINPQPQALWLFGAGHVGRAVARAVAPLGFALTWIDARAGQLPDPPLDGARQLALALPELAVDEAPPDTVFLVMTHSHPLDEAICEAILRRGDFAYLGLIGSDTKRARFVSRLRAAGIPPAALERLVCPIGIPGIESKEPAAIAAAVAADLLIRRERETRRARGRAAHGE